MSSTLLRLSAPVRKVIQGNHEHLLRIAGGSISSGHYHYGRNNYSTVLVGGGNNLVATAGRVESLGTHVPTRSFFTSGGKEKGDAAATLPIPSEDHVRSLFHLWNDALATKDPRLVTKRYAKDAVLLPTVSDEPRTDAERIQAYFEAFLKLEPQGDIVLSKVYAGPGWAQDVGIYNFTMGATQKQVKARYSFVYVYEDNQWKILHHHSSQMPEEVTSINAPKLTPEQVRNLFHLWNDALDTLDAKTVANRYTKDAVLLPTVSDVARTTPESIEDYFKTFLQSKPQGVILESHVEFGPNWAKDVGIYEFTLRGNDNKIVKARYSYVYRYEDGEWKISHHHSSQMPEGLMAAAAAWDDHVKKA